MNYEAEKLVISGDLHANPDRVRALYACYGDSVDGYIFTGDIVDGPYLNETLNIIIDIGALSVRGNHEQHLLGALLEQNEELRRNVAVPAWSFVEDRTLESYGVYPTLATAGNALRLRDKMPQAHIEFLISTPMFMEFTDFVVMHAGVTAMPWAEQRTYLHTVKTANDNGKFIDEQAESFMPLQLGEEQKEVNELDLKASGLEKQLLSGHFHRPIDGCRVRNNGQHLLLASPKRANYIYSYESWTDSVRVINVG